MKKVKIEEWNRFKMYHAGDLVSYEGTTYELSVAERDGGMQGFIPSKTATNIWTEVETKAKSKKK